MTKTRIIAAILASTLVAVATASAEDSLATTRLWYGPALRSHFPSKIPIHGWDYPVAEIPCLPTDITKFDLTASVTTAFGGRAFQVRGSVSLSALPSPFDVVDGAQGRRYMLHLQAYLFSPDGRLVWSQQGFPAGGAWMRASGQSAGFTLIGSYQRSIHGHELIVLAAGDPIFSSSSETRVILGVKRVVLP